MMNWNSKKKKRIVMSTSVPGVYAIAGTSAAVSGKYWMTLSFLLVVSDVVMVFVLKYYNVVDIYYVYANIC